MTIGPAHGLTNRLADLRRARGWTQEDLATRTGVTRKTINTIERAVFVPSTTLALRLGAVLGLPVEAIFALTGRDPAPQGSGDDTDP